MFYAASYRDLSETFGKVLILVIFFSQIEAKDPDSGRNGQVVYTIQRGVNATSANDQFFAVDAHQGNVVVANKPLPVGRHTIFVEAADQPINPSERRFSLAVITIHVISTGNKESCDSNSSVKGFLAGFR